MNLEEKPKKQNKKNIIITLLNIITLLAAIFLIISIYMISGVENAIRYIGIIILFIINIMLILVTRKLFKTNKKSTITISIIISIILILTQTLLGYFIQKTYN